MDKKYFFMCPLLDLFGHAPFFYRMVTITLRVLATLIVLLSLTTFFQAGKLIFELPTHGILGGVLFEVFFVVAVYGTVQVFFLRSRDIDQLKPGEFYILPLGAILVKLLGEAYAVFVGLVAIGGGVFVWFTNLKLAKVLNPFIVALFPSVRDDPSFIGGIEFMASGVLAAIVALVVTYLIAEVLMLLGRLARNGTESRSADTNRDFRSRFGS